MLFDQAIQFIVLGPGLAALIAGLFQKFIGDRGSMVVTTGTVGMAGILSLYQLFAYAAGAGGAGHVEHASLAADTGEAASYVGQHIIHLFTWMDVGGFKADWAIRVDAMSIVMMAVITSVSGLVHLYSWGYMEDDPHRARFFSYLSLFTFAMLMLVTADNFIQLFLGWEGVGLAFYVLIGFWYQNKVANDAVIIAFVSNRVRAIGLTHVIIVTCLMFG